MRTLLAIAIGILIEQHYQIDIWNYDWTTFAFVVIVLQDIFGNHGTHVTVR